MHAAAHRALNAATPPTVISTAGVGISDRREFWETSARILFGTLRLELQTHEPFSASLEYSDIGDIVFCRLAADVPHGVVRSDAVARHDNRAFVKVVLQTKGSSIIQQAGRTALLRAGQWTIYSMEQAYRVTVPTPGELAILVVPRHKVLPGAFDLRTVALQRFSGRHGLGKLIWSLVSATFDQMMAIRGRSGHEVADIVEHLTRLALLDVSDVRAPFSEGELLRDRVKGYIENHLGDPELSIAKLATVNHCSKRYLHMIFRPEKISISDYILQSRLEHCRANLLDPGQVHRSITQIAYSWGFSNSNHFSRCFKRAFGISPRGLRSERSLLRTVSSSNRSI